MDKRNSEFFSTELQDKLRSQFYYLNEDMFGERRTFFENAGGALRLKSAVETYGEISAIPDSPVRDYPAAQQLNKIIKQGKNDVRLLLNASGGEVAISLTASKIIFEMICTAAENSESGNIVTTSIEHPSSFDACQFSSDTYNHELRVAEAEHDSGRVSIESILKKIDKNTRIVSLILTSNITGAMHDIIYYTKKIKEKNANVYIVVDAVQGAPHEPIDLASCYVDAINIAPYKMFGNRGVAFAWMSDRFAGLPHHRLLATEQTNWDLGSAAPAHYASFSKVIDYITQIGSYYIDSSNRRELIEEGMTRIQLQEQAILNRLLNGSDEVLGTRQLQNVDIHFEEANGVKQDLILALTFDNVTNAKAVDIYAEHGVVVYARESSSHYSKRILESVGLDSLVRVSPVHIHNKDDVDRFLEVTKVITEM